MKKLDSRHGNAIIQGLIGITLVGVLAAAVPSLLGYFQDRRKVVRAQTILIQAKTEVASVLSNPESFTSGCEVNDCALRAELFADDPNQSESLKNLLLPILGSGLQCANPDETCGLRVAEIRGTDSASDVLEADLEFVNFNLPLKGTTIRVPKPSALAGSVTCDVSTPIFKGFNPQGNAICLAAQQTTCPQGEVSTGFDWQSMQTICVPIQTTRFACAAGEMIASIDGWSVTSGKATPNLKCKARINPWDLTPAPALVDHRTCEPNCAATNTTLTVTYPPSGPGPAPATPEPPPPPPPSLELGACKSEFSADKKYIVTTCNDKCYRPYNGGQTKVLKAPETVSEVEVIALGSGGGYSGGYPGGKGGKATGTFTVSESEEFVVVNGCKGIGDANHGIGGALSGVFEGSTPLTMNNAGADRALIVAGAGGGACGGSYGPAGAGGDGGGLQGTASSTGSAPGTQSSGYGRLRYSWSNLVGMGGGGYYSGAPGGGAGAGGSGYCAAELRNCKLTTGAGAAAQQDGSVILKWRISYFEDYPEAAGSEESPGGENGLEGAQQ